jgi:hypothetical protein
MLRMLQAAAAAVTLLAITSADAFQQKPAPQKPAPQKTAPRVNPNAATLADFLERVKKYVELHKKLEATLPKLPERTDPYQIDKHQRAMLRLMQDARKTARQGDLFTPAMQRLVRDLLRPVFSGPDGRQLRSEILDDEYTGNVKLAVNGRYPDEVPISTVPPQVLAQLPELPEDLEYRFVRTNMILFDPHAHIIADFIPQAFK